VALSFPISAVTVVFVWAMLAAVLSAYVFWSLRATADRRPMWREALRRAGIAPLLFAGLVVSQRVADRVHTPVDNQIFFLVFSVAWIIPPAITAVKQLRAGRVAIDRTSVPSADARPMSSATALIVLVACAVTTLGAWLVFVISRVSDGLVGTAGMGTLLVLLVTLFLLTRRAERSISAVSRGCGVPGLSSHPRRLSTMSCIVLRHLGTVSH
jgi:hypothetical protein